MGEKIPSSQLMQKKTFDNIEHCFMIKKKNSTNPEEKERNYLTKNEEEEKKSRMKTMYKITTRQYQTPR